MSSFRLQQTLSIWPDEVRGGPNPLLRSAFFAAVASKHRKIFADQAVASKEPEGVLIAAQDGVTVKYTGTQLNQYDADVFFEILHRSRRSPLGTFAIFVCHPAGICFALSPDIYFALSPNFASP